MKMSTGTVFYLSIRKQKLQSSLPESFLWFFWEIKGLLWSPFYYTMSLMSEETEIEKGNGGGVCALG